MKYALSLVAWVALASGCMGQPEDVGGISAEVATGDTCSLVGAGTIPSGDSFSGSLIATLSGEGASGTWVHLGPETATGGGGGCDRHPGHCRGRGHSHHGRGHGHGHARHEHCGSGGGTTQDRFEGTVDAAVCIPNGVVHIDVLGTGTWNGVPGYSFNMVAIDAVPDTYYIDIVAPDGTVVHTALGDLDSGGLETSVYY